MMALKFKTYTWPNDPHTYREELHREPQYTTQSGTSTYTGMGATHRRITGSGAFFGEDAYANFRALMELAADNTAGDLVHPIWGTRYCYFTKLEMTQEPRENYVTYSFEFTQAKADGTVPK